MFKYNEGKKHTDSTVSVAQTLPSLILENFFLPVTGQRVLLSLTESLIYLQTLC